MTEKRKVVAVILRHGQTVLNKQRAYRSRLDPSLDKLGFSQAEDAAAYIYDHYDITRVVCSPLLRACQTAQTVADRFGLDVVQDRGLLCWNLGFLSGKDKDTYEIVLEHFIENPKLVIPEGESLDDLDARVKGFFLPELKAKRKGITLYVTHTSDIISLGNLFDENVKGKPEIGESSVEPGGLMVVYETPKGFIMEPVFGEEEKNAEFGS